MTNLLISQVAFVVFFQFDCLPEWAKKTMDEHRLDKREYIYSYRELEEGYTHDIYWNAAQFELVFTHKVSIFFFSFIFTKTGEL